MMRGKIGWLVLLSALLAPPCLLAQPTEKSVEAEIIKLGGRVVRDVSLASRGAPVFAVSLDNLDLSTVEVPSMAVFEKMYRVTLSGCKNTDTILDQLQKLPKLTSLSVENSDMTDAGLRKLGKFPALKDLDLTRANKLTARGLAAVANCTKLEVLNLSETAISNESLATYSTLTSLKELRLHKTKLTLEQTGTAFLKWGALKLLETNGSPINDKGLIPIGVCAALEELNLSGSPITDVGLKPLNKLEALKRLHLSECARLTGSGFGNLQDLRKLEDLILSDTRVSDDGLSTIARLTGIKKLDLDRTKITDKGLESLATARDLTTLSLEETSIGNTSLTKVVEKAKKLEIVAVHKTAVTPAGAAIMQKINPELSFRFE